MWTASWGTDVYVLNKTDWTQQSNLCEPSDSLDHFYFNIAQSGGSDSHCISSGNSDILDRLFHRITFTNMGHTTLRVFIVSHIQNMTTSFHGCTSSSTLWRTDSLQHWGLSCMWSYSYIMNARNEMKTWTPLSSFIILPPSLSFAIFYFSCCSIMLHPLLCLLDFFICALLSVCQG